MDSGEFDVWGTPEQCFGFLPSHDGLMYACMVGVVGTADCDDELFYGCSIHLRAVAAFVPKALLQPLP